MYDTKLKISQTLFRPLQTVRRRFKIYISSCVALPLALYATEMVVGHPELVTRYGLIRLTASTLKGYLNFRSRNNAFLLQRFSYFFN